MLPYIAGVDKDFVPIPTDMLAVDVPGERLAHVERVAVVVVVAHDAAIDGVPVANVRKTRSSKLSRDTR